MDDPRVYLEKMSAFSKMLRLEGLSVSPKETEDACRVLIALGMADRQRVKTALRTVYAKSREEQAAFDRVFDGFFLSREAMEAQAQRQMEQERETAERERQAEEELRQNGQASQLTEEQRKAYAAMSEQNKERLRNFMEKYRDSAARNPNLYSNFIHSVFARAILEQQMMMENAGLGGMEADPELGLMYRDISEFKDAEIPKAIAIIQGITRQMNGELSARRNRAGSSGKLDFRRTIRRGLETGGSLYRLEFRRKRRRRRRLVLLCDVSGSMVQFSEFALRFIQNLNQVSDGSRVFLFSEGLHEADSFSLQNMDSFRSYVRASGLYGRGTDLGAALEGLCDAKPAALGAASTLLILSDTKTVDQQRALRALQEVKRRCGRVIWLNPIPEGKWQYIHSCQTFSSLTAMVSCSTLRDLAAACRRLTDG